MYIHVVIDYSVLQVIQTLRYRSLLTNNSISNNTRTIRLWVEDIYGLTSDVVTISLVVKIRNDEPDVKIDETIHYTENALSIAIVTQHLLDIVDEEMHNISSMNITLVALNGKLDEGDIIFLRSPKTALSQAAELMPKQVYVNYTATVEDYEEFLRSVRYINEEEEPTYLANVTTREVLNREVLLQITDSAPSPSTAIHRIKINLTLINDNKPVVSLNVANGSCLSSYPGGSISKRSAPLSGRRPYRRLDMRKKAMDMPIGTVSF